MNVIVLTSLKSTHPLIDLCEEEVKRLGKFSFFFDCLPYTVDDNTLYISFLGDVIVPKEKIAKHMFNTHPGPPHYRGWGSRIRTLTDKRDTHGATLHRIHEKVDWGEIVKTEYFPVDSLSTPNIIHYQAEIHCLRLVRWLIDQYIDGIEVKANGEQWSGKQMLKKDYLEAMKEYKGK